VAAKKFSFPKSRRLARAAEFEKVKRNGRVQHGRLILLNVLEIGDATSFRAGFVTSRAVGLATTRNRVRRRLREIVASMPLEYLLLETDSPDQPLHGHQGARNEPSLLTEVCACVAALRGVATDEIAAATTSNAQRLFGLPPG